MASSTVTHTALNAKDFFPRGGEMGALVRSYPWEKSSLGPMEQWPQSLLTTLSIILNSKFPMFLFWGKDLVCFYNDAYRPSLGNSGKHPKALGQKGEECWPEIWDFIKPIIDNVFAGGEASWNEDQLLPIFRNGQMEEVYWTFSYSPVINESGQVGGVFVTCSETTDKVKTLSRVTQNEDELKFAIEAAELATFDLNPVTNKFSANERLKKWFGLSPEAEIDLTIAIDSIAEEDKERVSKAIRDSLLIEEGGKYEILYTIVNPVNGVRRIVRAKGKTTFNEEQVAIRLNGTLQDITKEETSRKRTEQNEENLRNIFEQAPVAMVLFKGPQLIIDIVNKHTLLHWGKTLEQTKGKPLFEVLPEIKGKNFGDVLLNVYTTGQSYSAYDVPVTFDDHENKRTIYVTFTYEAYRERTGEISGVMAISTDVTAQVIARQTIEEAKARERLAIELGELGTYELNFFTQEIQTSDRFKTIWGIDNTTKREVYAEYIHPDDRQIRTKAHEDSLKTGNLFYEVRLLRKDNSIDWIKVRGKVLYDAQGVPASLLGVIQNITEQKLFSEQLKTLVEERTRELQRSNEDLLQFAHVTSHDLKEPVRKIRTFNSRLKEEFEDTIPEKGKMYIDKVQHSTERMFAMIEGVLTYSTLNSSEAPIEQIDLNETIKQIEIDLEIAIQAKHATLETRELPVIEGAPILIHQLFYNLINNSLKFSVSGTPPKIKISADALQENGKDYSRIKVSDNGIGFDKQFSEKIFGAFSRLHPKDTYEGTGLGLALCRRIVERHHGRIIAEGHLNGGAVFTILLPLKQTQKII